MTDHADVIREALDLAAGYTAMDGEHSEMVAAALAALDALVAERDEARRLLREVVKADQQDAQMGYPIPGDSCMGAFIGLVLMQYLDSLAKEDTYG